VDSVSTDGEREDLARLLDEVGRREAEERRAGDALEDAPALHDVERVLEDVWASSRPRRARPRLLYVGLLAAAAVVVGMLILRPQTSPSVAGPSGEVLGEGELSIERPDAPLGQWPKKVVWKGPRGLEYVLRIVEFTDGVEGRVLLAPRAIIALERGLPEKETPTWPDKIKLLLEARNKEGARQGSAEAVWERSH